MNGPSHPLNSSLRAGPCQCLNLGGGVDGKRFIPHIEVIHQSFCQAGRCSDSLSPPLLWGWGEKGLEWRLGFLKGGARGSPPIDYYPASCRNISTILTVPELKRTLQNIRQAFSFHCF